MRANRREPRKITDKGRIRLVKLLEENGYDGARHFDAHAYRTEDAGGV